MVFGTIRNREGGEVWLW